MTSDRELTGFRQWTLDVLGLLGATADRQSAYVRHSGVGTDELLLQFDDVLHVARARVADGSLDPEKFALLEKVDEKVAYVNSGPSSIWSESALETAAEWRELRIAAGTAKKRLESSWELNSGQ